MSGTASPRSKLIKTEVYKIVKSIRFIILCLFLAYGFTATSQETGKFEKREFTLANKSLLYRILYPQNFDSSKSYSLIIFLHGGGGKGIDNEAQLASGGNYFLQKRIRDSFPAIVIYPQCPPEDTWAFSYSIFDATTMKPKGFIFPSNKKPTPIVTMLMRLIDSMLQQKFVNRKRIYIAGLSMGGMGVLDIIARYPDIFAAGISICGAGNSSTSKRFAGKVALWLFHGAKDNVVPVSSSRDFYKKLKKENADVRYTEYPNIFHDSWIDAFEEPEFMSWMFSKTK